MSTADVCAAILWIGVTLYAIFGGADFGAGVWDLLAGSGESAPSASAGRSIAPSAPVWEANHVWLIFVLVVLWTAFSQRLLGDLDHALHPASARRARDRAARLGLRLPPRPARAGTGAGDPGLRGGIRPHSVLHGDRGRGDRVGRGARRGRRGPDRELDRLPAPVTGALFVLVAAYTAAVFLVRDSGAAGDEELRDYFSRRALVVAVVAGAAAVRRGDRAPPGRALHLRRAHLVARHRLGRPVGICGLAALGLLVTGRYRRSARGRRGRRSRDDLGLLRRGIPVHPADLAEDLGRRRRLADAHRGDRGLRESRP